MPLFHNYFATTVVLVEVCLFIDIYASKVKDVGGCHVSHRLRSNRVDVESTGTRSWMTSLLFLAVKKMMHPGILVERASLIPIAILI